MADRLTIFRAINTLLALSRSEDKESICNAISDLEVSLECYSDIEFVKKQRHILEQFKIRNDINEIVVPSPLPLFEPISIDTFVKEIKPGVSLVTCCMNRSENLLKALESWLKCPEISQIVIVDWSSKIPFSDELKAASIFNEKILILRINGQSRWILSYAYNLGFRIAEYDKILKTDADIVINSTFFSENPLRESTFLSGDWRTAPKGQEHINGFFFVKRADLFSIKGFNEYITTYGWDDDDIYFRLEQHGFNRVRINASGVYHIPHDDAQRLNDNSQINNALDELRINPGAKIMGNRFLAAAMPMWDSNRFFIPFKITLQLHGYLEARQSAESYYPVATHIRDDADYYGSCSALSWSTSLDSYNINKENFYALLNSRKCISDISKMDVRLAALSNFPCCWHHKIIVVYFDKKVTYDHSQHFILALLKQSKKFLFTVFTDTALIKWIEARQGNPLTNNILPIPEGFHTYDLIELNSLSSNKIEQTFAEENAFFIKLNTSDIDNFENRNLMCFPEQRRRIFIHVQHGLGNRLRALASAISISRQIKRELVLIWIPDNHCDCTIHELFKYDGMVITDLKNINLEGVEQYTYMEIEDDSCKDKYINFNTNKDIYIRSAYVINNELSTWEKENKILQQMEPIDKIKNLINSINIYGRIGLHVRMEGSKGTDKNTYDMAENNWLPKSHQELNEWREKSHYKHFFKEINRILEENEKCTFFLATDTQINYQIFEDKYGDKLTFLKRNAYDRSKEQLQYALADVILLSKCEFLLGSGWSSFTELAQRFSFSMGKVKISGKDF